MTTNLAALVLNADYQPLTRFPLTFWDVEKTARSVIRGRVTVVAEYDTVLRSQRHSWRAPSVVALIDYVNRPIHVPFTRENIFMRDEFRCQYCGHHFNSRDLTFDHVVPRAAGGGTSWSNIATACGPCNSAKGHRRDMRPIRQPREPSSAELVRKRRLRPENFHATQLDVLYWSGILERDD